MPTTKIGALLALPALACLANRSGVKTALAKSIHCWCSRATFSGCSARGLAEGGAMEIGPEASTGSVRLARLNALAREKASKASS